MHFRYLHSQARVQSIVSRIRAHCTTAGTLAQPKAIVRVPPESTNSIDNSRIRHTSLDSAFPISIPTPVVVALLQLLRLIVAVPANSHEVVGANMTQFCSNLRLIPIQT